VGLAFLQSDVLCDFRTFVAKNLPEGGLEESANSLRDALGIIR